MWRSHRAEARPGEGLSPSQFHANFRAFLWHSVFLALAVNFVEINTVVPAMVLRAGGGAFLLGLISAVLLGGASLFQLFFAGPLSRRLTKKGPLLAGIHLRIASLAVLGALYGILLEISNDSNRAAYAGIGAGSLLVMVFPLVAGKVISQVGFGWVFFFVAVMMSVGLFVSLGLRCDFSEADSTMVGENE